MPTARIGDNDDWVYPSGPVKITEAQQQTYELQFWLDKTNDVQVQSVKEGLPASDDTVEAIQIRLVPKPARTEDITYYVAIQGISPVAYTLAQGASDPAGAQVGGRADGGTVGTHDYATLTLVANDGNRTDDIATVTLHGGTVQSPEEFATAELTINDIHNLPEVTAQWTDSSGAKLATQPTSAKEGDVLYLTLTVDRADADGAIASTLDNLKIALEPSGAATKVDYELGTIATVSAGTTDATTPAIKLTLEEDIDVNDEMLVFDAKVTPVETTYGTGEEVSEEVLSILIEDTTALNIQQKSGDDVDDAYKKARTKADEAGNGDGLWTAAGDPGDGPLTIQLADLFELPEEGFLVTGDARSSDITVATADADGTMVMVTPKSDGEATITVTAGVAASSAQISPNLATVAIDVTVDALPQVVTVTTSPTGSVEEGGTVTVTAKLNQMAQADTAIDLNVQGPVEGGDDHSVTIRAGAMTGEADLTVSNDEIKQKMSDIVIITGTEAEGVEVKPQVITLKVTEDGEADALTVTVSADPTAIDEGGSTRVTATANRNVVAVDGEVKINLAVVGDGTWDEDATAIGGVIIGVGADSAYADLTSTDDADHEPNGETLTVVASGVGIEGNQSITITVADNDAPVAPTVRAKDGAAGMIAGAISEAAGTGDWMVGGMVATVDMSTLFDVDDDVTASFAGQSSDEAVVQTGVSGGTMLSLTPMSAGTATITVTGLDQAGGGPATVSHDATVVLQTLSITVSASGDAVTEGDSVTLTAEANRAVTEAVTLDVTVTGADADAVSADGTLTIAAGDTTGTATVMAIEDEDSADANVAVVVSGAALSGPATFPIAITDNDPTVTAKPQAEVDSTFAKANGLLPGDAAVSVDMSGLFTPNGSPTLDYEAMSSNEESVMISTNGSTLTLTPGETGDSTITVTATDTSGDPATDTATVSSIVTIGVLPLAITSVTASATDVMEGDTVEITAMANKAVDANVEVRLMRDGASTAGADDIKWDATAGVITIMAGDSSGKATLTVENDTETEPAETLTLIATHADLGQVGTVMITIAASDPKSLYTLSGPMDTNLVEGQSYELTVTADPAVQEDTEVPVMRDRAASDADDTDFTVAAVMLKAGEASGTTMLMVADDGVDDSGHGMPEALVLYIADGGADQRLSFNLWDAAVPALPVIAQLLLAAFLAIGGYRRYLRR